MKELLSRLSMRDVQNAVICQLQISSENLLEAVDEKEKAQEDALAGILRLEMNDPSHQR